jgi:glycine cleavage system H protein/acyl carrier protein
MLGRLFRSSAGAISRLMPGTAPTPSRYNAFISYSREPDAELAPALEEALEQFAKPWNRLRALRVFLDDADLSANTALWRSITTALDEAEFFILLASPAAAKSKWVNREVEYWRAHRDAERLLLVPTDGELAWDEAAGEFDRGRTNAVPEALRGAYVEEPRYTDLRWARGRGRLTLDDDRFREAVADLAGTIHGRPKDEMVGEQVRQHRKTIRLAQAAVTVLSLLTIAAIVAAILAIWQSRVAADQRDAARSRELAARASAQLAVDPAASVRLAAEALEVKPLAEGEQALRAALAESEVGAFATLRHNGPLLSAAFDPAGRRVVTASDDGTARVWDATTGASTAVLRGHRAAVRAAAFDSEGERVVTAGGEGTARIWDASSGKQLRTLRWPRANVVFSVAFDPVGTRVVTGGHDGTAQVWEAATGKRIAVLEGHRTAVLRASFDSSGRRIVTVSADGTARVWGAANGAAVAILRHKGINSAAFDDTATRVVTAGADGTARIWDASAGRPLATLRGHGGDVDSAAFDPEGTRVVTAGADGTARVWEAATGTRLAVLRGDGGSVAGAAFDAEGERIVAATGRTARIWDAETGESVGVLRGHENSVVNVSFDRSGDHVVTASADATARVWDVKPQESLGVLAGGVSSVAFDSEGRRLATVSEDGTVHVWDVATWKRLFVLHGHRGRITGATFTEEGERTDGPLRVWDAGTGGRTAVSGGDAGPVLASDPERKRVVVPGEGSTAEIRDAASGERLAVLRGHSEATSSPYAVGVLRAAFDPEGERVVTVGLDGTARVWEAATGKRLAVLRGHGNIVQSAVFDPTGQRIVTGGQEGTIRVWEAASGKSLAVLPSSTGSPGFDAEGKLILAAGAHGTARVWDAASGKLLAVLRGAALVEAFALAPDGKLIVTVDRSGTAQLYSCRPCGGPEDLLDQVAYYRRGLRAPIALGGDIAARRETFEEIRRVVAEHLGIDASGITEDASFEDDLGAEELDLIDLVTQLEDEFGIRIPDEALARIQTVAQVVDSVLASQLTAAEWYPDDLWYHPGHDWARVEGDEATLGITWHAQRALGEVVYFEPPQIGQSIAKDSSYGEFESVKAVSDVIAPLSGEVIEVNQMVVGAPETVNEDPYRDGWLVRIRLSDPSEVDALLDADAYQQGLPE